MEEQIINQTRESIKLIKGQKGFYGFEIKIFIDNQEDDKALARLEAINKKLNEKYKVEVKEIIK